MKPKCVCGGTICQNKAGDPAVRRFRCVGCRRLVPWCFGAADDMPLHCDDCWAEMHATTAALDGVGPGDEQKIQRRPR